MYRQACIKAYAFMKEKQLCEHAVATVSWKAMDYSLIAFDERVTFWLQPVWSLLCAFAYVALFVRRLAYNHYAIAHAYNAAKHAHTRQ